MKNPLLTLRVVVVEFDSLISMIEKFGEARQKVFQYFLKSHMAIYSEIFK